LFWGKLAKLLKKHAKKKPQKKFFPKKKPPFPLLRL